MKGVFPMAKKSNSALISALLYILVGVLLVVFKTATIGWMMTIVGALFVVFGILDLVKSNWGSGAVSLIIGIAILVLGWIVTEIVLLVLGILIALKGLVALIDACRASRKNIVDFIFAILTVVIGVMIAFGNGLEILIVIAGVMLIVDGILGLIGSVAKK
jgi:uncharacterized membrane protein HdeD (DUF308 family)